MSDEEAVYYAFVKNSLVVNVAFADEDFIQDLINAGTIDEAVLLAGETRPNIGDRYEEGFFVSALTKPAAIAQRILEFKQELREFVDARYDRDTRENFRTIFILAKENGKTNRLAYVKPLLEWAESIVSFSGQVAAALQGQVDADAVMLYRWSFTTLAASDPGVTLLAAVQIAD